MDRPALLKTTLALVVAAATLTGLPASANAAPDVYPTTYEMSYDPAENVVTVHIAGSDPAQRLTTGLSGAPFCDGCPSSWTSVAKIVVNSDGPLLWEHSQHNLLSNRADETKIEIHAPAAKGPDVELRVTSLNNPARVIGIGQSLDLNGDGDPDVTVASDDWSAQIWGGAGDDRLDMRAVTGISWGADGGGVSLSGFAGDDVLVGTSGVDGLGGGRGNDRLIGLAGNDSLNGEDGNDVLDAGAGNDRLDGRDGNDRLLGGAGNDWLYAGRGNDVLSGGPGRDALEGFYGDDVMNGGPGPDSFTDFRGTNVARGGAGRDWINFGSLDGPYKKTARSSRAICGTGYDTIASSYNVRRGCERIYWK